MHAGNDDLGHPPQRGDERVVVRQQFMNHGDDPLARIAQRLQVAAGAERSSVALDHDDTDGVVRRNLRGDPFECLHDREIDRIERGRPVQRDRRHRAIDAEEGGLVGGLSVGGSRGGHDAIPGSGKKLIAFNAKNSGAGKCGSGGQSSAVASACDSGRDHSAVEGAKRVRRAGPALRDREKMLDMPPRQHCSG